MSSEQLMTLKDRETQQMLSKDLAMEFQGLAKDMGLDLRLGHMLPMGGEPYITHEGLKYLLQAENGPGIKDCSYEWVHDDWDAQYFVAKCIITTDDESRYEGEGDAIGVPVAFIMDVYNQADKKLSPSEIRSRIKKAVSAYPIKNVSSPLAMDLAARRMAQTRAFNRAARIALKLALPTVEERVLEDSPTVHEGVVQGEGVVHLATSDQVDKIKEFAKSKKKGMSDLVLSYSENHGKPDGWPIDVASEFIDQAIVIVDGAKKAKKADKEGKNVKLEF